MTSTTAEKSKILAQIEAAKQREKEKEDQITRLTQIVEMQSQQIEAQQVASERQTMEMNKVTAALTQLAKSGRTDSQ